MRFPSSIYPRYPHALSPGADECRRRYLRSHIGHTIKHELFSRIIGMQVSPRIVDFLVKEVDQYLRQLRDLGFVPEHLVVTGTRVTGADTDSLVVELPWLFRVWLDEGAGMSMPKFEHDCESCMLLAHHGEYDYYHCFSGTPGHEWPTVLVRFGNDASDYMSGLEVGRSAPDDHPLRHAYHMAKERGLIDG